MALIITLILLSIADAHWIWYPVVIFYAFLEGIVRKSSAEAQLEILMKKTGRDNA